MRLPNPLITALALLLVGLVLAPSVQAQRPPVRRPNQNQQEDDKRPLPNDEKLLKLYAQFVKDAEALAKDYETKKEYDKARAVYREILNLIPQYAVAEAKLEEYRIREENNDKATVTVRADKDWQPAGVDAIEGKPLIFTVQGEWTVQLEVEVGPDGLTLPENLRTYKLGALVGAIQSPGTQEPFIFLIGGGTQITAPASGKVMLRIFDDDVKGNSGQLRVSIQGTFD